MKKTTILPLSIIIIAMLLIVSVVIPVMAASTISGDGTSDGGYYYKYSIQKNTNTGVAHINTPKAPTYLTATAVNTLNCTIGNSRVQIRNTNTGYASVSVTAGNSFVYNGIPITASINETTAEFKVGSEIVVPEGDYVIG